MTEGYWLMGDGLSMNHSRQPSAIRYRGAKRLSGEPSLRLQVQQQPIHFIIAFDLLKAIVEVVPGELGFGLADRFVAVDLLFHSLERSDRRMPADGDARVAGFPERARPPMLGQQHVALRLRLRELLFELGERGLQGHD